MAMERTGIEEIKQGYQMYPGCPYYAIFETQNSSSTKTGRLIFAYKEDDQKKGWDLLAQNLDALKAQDNNNRYVIQFYEMLGKTNTIDDRTPYSGSFLFRMKNYTPSMSGISPAAAADQPFLNYLQAELHREKEKNQELQDLVEELEQDLEDARQQPAGQEIGGLLGQIGQAGDQFPWFADMIKNIGAKLANALTPDVPQRRQPAGGIAGVATDAPPDVRINNAIQRLVAWYIKEYGQGATEEEKKRAGFEQFANDMQALAAITDDDDVMHLALKKLRATAA